MRLVIGYGNPLRSDDRLGQYLAEMLNDRWNIITSVQLTPELAEPISRAEQVVFIDASVSKTPGEVSCERVEPIRTAGAFTHNVTPASLLAAAQELYGAAPQAILISITGASFDYGCDFSAQTRARLPQIGNRVEALIAAFFAVQADRSARPSND